MPMQTAAAGQAAGGGMFNHSSSPTLADMLFQGNVAYSGGGMANDSASSRF